MRRFVRLFLLALLLPQASARSAERAPLPSGWVSEDPDDDETRYRPPPDLRGIYGHGFSSGGSPPRPDDPPVCVGNEAAQQALRTRLIGARAEFWFYATAEQGVLFRRRLVLDPTRPCAEAARDDVQVHRAYVADGMVHSVEFNHRDEVQAWYSRPLAATDGESSLGFAPLHNLMARGPAPNRPRGQRESRRVGGVRAECWTSGNGFVWGTVCLSRAAGPTYGMIVETAVGDDMEWGFQTSFDRLEPRALLDGRLFELQRRWRLAD